jgi:hypothetical protein
MTVSPWARLAVDVGGDRGLRDAERDEDPLVADIAAAARVGEGEIEDELAVPGVGHRDLKFSRTAVSEKEVPNM